MIAITDDTGQILGYAASVIDFANSPDPDGPPEPKMIDLPQWPGYVCHVEWPAAIQHVLGVRERRACRPHPCPARPLPEPDCCRTW